MPPRVVSFQKLRPFFSGYLTFAFLRTLPPIVRVNWLFAALVAWHLLALILAARHISYGLYSLLRSTSRADSSDSGST
jgi:hypothetical protein